MRQTKTFSAQPDTMRAIEDAAIRHGLSVSDALRRCVHFGLPLLAAEQIELQRHPWENMTTDQIQTHRRVITQEIKNRADKVLHEVITDEY